MKNEEGEGRKTIKRDNEKGRRKRKGEGRKEKSAKEKRVADFKQEK